MSAKKKEVTFRGGSARECADGLEQAHETLRKSYASEWLPFTTGILRRMTAARNAGILSQEQAEGAQSAPSGYIPHSFPHTPYPSPRSTAVRNAPSKKQFATQMLNFLLTMGMDTDTSTSSANEDSMMSNRRHKAMPRLTVSRNLKIDTSFDYFECFEEDILKTDYTHYERETPVAPNASPMSCATGSENFVPIDNVATTFCGDDACSFVSEKSGLDREAMSHLVSSKAPPATPSASFSVEVDGSAYPQLQPSTSGVLVAATRSLKPVALKRRAAAGKINRPVPFPLLAGLSALRYLFRRSTRVAVEVTGEGDGNGVY